MSYLALLFIVGFLLVVTAFGAVFLLTECNRRRVPKPSPWQYGSGAYHDRQSLPPITHTVTSTPTGSADPSAWPNSRTVPNRRPHQH